MPEEAESCGCPDTARTPYRRPTTRLSVGEPILAIEEANDVVLLGCGSDGCGPAGSSRPGPSHLRIEQLVHGPDGTSYMEARGEVPFPGDFVKSCAGGACLPKVTVRRDPDHFRAWFERARKIGPISSSKQVYTLMKDELTSRDQEAFFVFLLDTQCFVRGFGEIARGASDRVETPVPDVLRLPIVSEATSFIVLHNHPSGHAKPSAADKELTKVIEKAGDLIGVPMFDHIIIGAKDYYSFADEKKKRSKKK